MLKRCVETRDLKWWNNFHRAGLSKGASIDEVCELTKIDRWFLRNVQQIVVEANSWKCALLALRWCPVRSKSDSSLTRSTSILLVESQISRLCARTKSTEIVDIRFRADPQQQSCKRAAPAALGTIGCYLLRHISAGRFTSADVRPVERRTLPG
jgi:hypothetical protein